VNVGHGGPERKKEGGLLSQKYLLSNWETRGRDEERANEDETLENWGSSERKIWVGGTQRGRGKDLRNKIGTT